MEQYVLICFLGVNSWTDIRYRKVSLCSVGAYLLVGIFYQCLYRKEAAAMLLGLIPGILLVAVSKATREALGMGDALLMLVLGMYLGLWAAVEVLFAAMFLAAIWAGALLFVKKKGRDYEFPFVPFLLLAYVGRWLLCV